MIIGITGRTCSGKSMAIEILKSKFTFQLFDLDQIGHELLNQDEIKNQLIKAFGKSILDKQQIVRTELAKIVFKDSKKLLELNQIVHPKIKQYVLDRIHDNKTTVICGSLIKEIGLENACDSIIVIDAEDKLITEKHKFALISKYQRTREAYLQEADIVIINNFDASFESKLLEIYLNLDSPD
ncbi:MAG: dephospho-CoA kinase [Candidatus Margulisiibacteriota bacterium]|jgi:dephospho-CoA kinase